MFELLYASASPEEPSESDLTRILETARSNNARSGITGMLIYHDREFLQILEGDEAAVHETFKTISKDRRHSNIRVFYQGEIDQRAFADWSMAFRSLDSHAVDEITAGYEGLDKELSPISMVSESPNLGRKIFASLRDKL